MTIVAAAAEGQFLGVEWDAFVLVFLAALVATALIVGFYSVGLRLMAVGTSDESGDRVAPRPAAATIGGYACFAIGAAAVLYGVYLIVPQLHGG